MTVPTRASEATLLEVRQALQRIELNRRTGVQHNFTATADPTVDADESQGYSAGSRWYYGTPDRYFICTDATKGAAAWYNPFDGAAAFGTAAVVGTGAYAPSVPADWEDPDPTSIPGALDRTAGGHAGVVLIGDTEPTNPAVGQAWLDTSAVGSPGSGVLAVTTITADATLVGSHTVVLCDATTAAITITLPAAASNEGRRYFVKKIDSSANTITIDGNASETVDGDLTAVLTSQYEAIMVICDGSNWHIL